MPEAITSTIDIAVDPIDFPHPVRGARLWFLCMAANESEEMTNIAVNLERKIDAGTASPEEVKQFLEWRENLRNKVCS